MLDSIRRVGKANGYDTYLVGGAVRDVLINNSPRDLDVMVNGDALKFSEILKESRPDLIKKIHLKKSVGRSVVYTDKMSIDIVPLCCDGSRVTGKDNIRKALNKNVKSRDYTINAMFIRLGEDLDGKIKLKLIDKAGGKKDLSKNVLRGVNLDNFGGNHVQAMRGIRLLEKFGMKKDKDTLDVLKGCFEKTGKRSFGYYCRYVKEFKRIFELSKNPIDSFKILKKYNFFKSLHL